MQQFNAGRTLNFSLNLNNNMKKQFFVMAAAAALVFSSCMKKKDECTFQDVTVVAPPSEISALQGWISGNAPTAVQHSSGVFYIINNPGSGATASVCSNITVKYAGTLLNNTPFDSNTTGYSSLLGQLILGWQKGIPLIKAGGSITLYIPPSLGYGSQDTRDRNGVIIIPANSNLKFTIDLVAVQ